MSDKEKVSTQEELDALLDYMFPTKGNKPKNDYVPKEGEASQEEIDEIFKHMNI